MKNRITKLALLLLSLLSLSLATGCLVRTQPAEVVAVSAVAPPAEVYYGGRTLHYRTDGYYYYDGGAWLVAPAVPSYLATYHRPYYAGTTYRPMATRPTSYRPATRPTSYRPAPRPTSYRPTAGARPTTVRSPSARPTSYRPTTGARPATSSRPTSVSRPGGSGMVSTPHGARPTQGRSIQSR